MKENDVEFIATQFGIQKEIVEASVNDGTLSSRIKDSLSSKVIYGKDEFETFKKNYTAEVQTSYFNDLVEKAKKGDIPTELYKPVKGSSYQQLERDLSKDYEITDYSDVRDLISKAIQKQSANGKPNAEIEKQINELKTANLKLVKDKEEALTTIEQKYKTQIIEREKRDAISKIPFDFTGIKPEELEKVKEKTQTILKSVFDTEFQMDYDDTGRIVVKDKTGNVKKNEATRDPLPIDNVMVDLAKEYNLKLISPDKGGQGGKSSGGGSTTFSNAQEFQDYCKTQGINPLSKEAMELYRNAGLNKIK